MINSPVLDTVIGLVFIFLLYSLLTTSVKEMMATLFSFRARMLKKGIVEGMLCNSKRPEWILDGTLKAIWKPIKEFAYLILGYRPKEHPSLGQKFYSHPIIKNYGSDNRFRLPSYLPKENFSTILIEVLKNYYENHKEDKDKEMVKYVKEHFGKDIDLEKLPTITSIYYLIKYLQYKSPEELKDLEKGGFHIEKETIEILALHLEKSYRNLEAFEKMLETWFDDSMNRVSGWYKRQAQFILFFIGFLTAVAFNVDIIDITGKLSTDKDARDKLVQIAIKESEGLKNDPRVKKQEEEIAILRQNSTPNADSIKKAEDDFSKLNAKLNEEKDYAKKLLNERIKESNNLMALGWGDYGIKKDSAQNWADYGCELKLLIAKARKEMQSKLKPEQIKDSARIYFNSGARALYDKHWIRLKVGHIVNESRRGKKFLGFLLLGFGVCLGAPFWFDLLQKLIKVRSAGKKEDGDTTSAASAQQPVQLTVNNNTNPQALG